MDPQYEAKYHRLENNHFWFVGARDLILRLMRPFGAETRVLDIGCSGGATMTCLKYHGYRNLTGIDKSARAVDWCWTIFGGMAGMNSSGNWRLRVLKSGDSRTGTVFYSVLWPSSA